jgi:hypothetical protein
MRADICDPNDKSAVEQFLNVLKSINAERLDHIQSCVGVDLFKYRIGTDILYVFVDSWSLDIEAPDELVDRILKMLKCVRVDHQSPPVATGFATKTGD